MQSWCDCKIHLIFLLKDKEMKPKLHQNRNYLQYPIGQGSLYYHLPPHWHWSCRTQLEHNPTKKEQENWFHDDHHDHFFLYINPMGLAPVVNRLDASWSIAFKIRSLLVQTIFWSHARWKKALALFNPRGGRALFTVLDEAPRARLLKKENVMSTRMNHTVGKVLLV